MDKTVIELEIDRSKLEHFSIELPIKGILDVDVPGLQRGADWWLLPTGNSEVAVLTIRKDYV